MLHAVPDLTAVDAAVLHAIDEIRHGLRHALSRPRRWNGTLRRQAQARSVRGSNSIEGIIVSDDQALAIVGSESDQVSARTCRNVIASEEPLTASHVASTDT